MIHRLIAALLLLLTLGVQTAAGVNELYGRYTSKPGRGTQIDWSHPHAQGLVTYVPLLEGAGRAFDLAGLKLGTAFTDLAWKSTRAGVGLQSSAANATAENTFVVNPISGLTSATIVSWFYPTSDSSTSTANECLGFCHWETGELFVINRVMTSGTQIRGVFGLSTTDADLTVNQTFSAQTYYSLAWVLTNSVLTVYVNGVQIAGSATGSGTIKSNTVGYELFAGSPTGSNKELAFAVGLGGAIYNRALSPAMLLSLYREPYAVLLQPNARRWGIPVVTGAPSGGGMLLMGVGR